MNQLHTELFLDDEPVDIVCQYRTHPSDPEPSIVSVYRTDDLTKKDLLETLDEDQINTLKLTIEADLEEPFNADDGDEDSNEDEA